MAPRQFTIDDHVRLALDSSLAHNNPRDMYTISRMLPIQADAWQYRVKRISDGQERVVSESQVVKVAPGPASGRGAG